MNRKRNIVATMVLMFISNISNSQMNSSSDDHQNLTRNGPFIYTEAGIGISKLLDVNNEWGYNLNFALHHETSKLWHYKVGLMQYKELALFEKASQATMIQFGIGKSLLFSDSRFFVVGGPTYVNHLQYSNEYSGMSSWGDTGNGAIRSSRFQEVGGILEIGAEQFIGRNLSFSCSVPIMLSSSFRSLAFQIGLKVRRVR